MKIAVVSRHDPLDIASWSGTPYFMVQEIQKISDDVVFIRPKKSRWTLPVTRYLYLALKALVRRNIDLSLTNIFSRLVGKDIEDQIKQHSPDVIVGIAASPELANINDTTPIIHVSDATYAAMKDYYNQRKKVPLWLQHEGDDLEQKVIGRSSVSVFPSKWASDSAVNDYGAKSEKIRTFLFGANVSQLPEADEEYFDKKFNETCRLLFIGRDWHRKGGDIVLSMFKTLKDRNFDVELTVVGCDPFSGDLPEGIKVYKEISKDDPVQYGLYNKLFSEASFFVLPTKAEAFGIVFSEAAAYATPVVAAMTGGVPSVVENEKTGLLLPLSAQGSDYADVVMKLWEDKEALVEMGKNAQIKYSNELNWNSWRKNMSTLIHSLCDQKMSSKKPDANIPESSLDS